VGDIYLGKVINILENINVAFIRLDKRKQNGFMMLKDDSYFNKNIRLGEDIVVQIIKEEISKKGPTVTQKIFFEDEKIKVYPYNKNDSIFERKFNFSQRQYLQIVTKLIKPKDSSIEFKEKDNKINIWEIIQRLKRLEKQSFIIKRKIKNIIDSSCLISNKQEILEILLKKNLIQKDAVIITKSKAEGVKIRKNLNLLSVKKKNFYIEYCNEKIARNYKYYIEYLIKELLKPNIKLNTGGHITIQKTEALTSIDVNSGGFNKLKSTRETILWVNLSATKEIINQIKLKNISGIIVIDFIDMINQDDQLSLIEYLSKELRLSFLNETKIIQISEIGLVEITRQRGEKNIYDMFTKQCLICQGLGCKRSEKVQNKLSSYFIELTSIFG
jgi:ribonuclease G